MTNQPQEVIGSGSDRAKGQAQRRLSRAKEWIACGQPIEWVHWSGMSALWEGQYGSLLLYCSLPDAFLIYKTNLIKASLG